MKSEFITHSLQPVFDHSSRILMLGTMPSPRSREAGFYYGHPRNRFWKVLSDVMGERVPETKEEKLSFLLRSRIAVWDVLKSCEIKGADDSSIRSPAANDLSVILGQADIKAIYTTGGKAFQMYAKFCCPQTRMEAVKLPSTSPANCRMTYEQLVEAYAVIRQYV